MLPVQPSSGPANPTLYDVPAEQSLAAREWNAFLVQHASLIRRNIVIGDREILLEGEVLEYFRNVLGDGNCFFHSVIASCLSERTFSDDRELGREVHTWAATQMGQLVEDGILDRAFLADYLEFSGGTVEDAVRIAQTDQARPTVQFTLSHLIARPIAYISRQSDDPCFLPTVGVYCPENAVGREPVFVAHEFYGASSSLDGGSGHYMVLRRRRQSETSNVNTISSDGIVQSSSTNHSQSGALGGEGSSLISAPPLVLPRCRTDSADSALSTAESKKSNKAGTIEKINNCRTCGSFLREHGMCSRCDISRDDSVHFTCILEGSGNVDNCVEKRKTPASGAVRKDRKVRKRNNCRACGSFVREPGICSRCNIRRDDSAGPTRTLRESGNVNHCVEKLKMRASGAARNEPDADSNEHTYFINMKDVFFNDVQFRFRTKNCLLQKKSPSYCENCLRWSTVMYPLEFKSITSNLITFRKYALLRKKRTVNEIREYCLCEACFVYMTGDERPRSIWSVAWPTFFAYTIVKLGFEEIWSWIPLELRIAWLPSLPYFHANLNHVTLLDPPPFFEDLTSRRVSLLGAIERMKGSELRDALNEECVAQVRCYCGGQEFLEDSGLLSVQYALVRHYPHMRESGVLLPRTKADNDFLGAARIDWLHSWVFLEEWRVGPSVIVDNDKGLCLLVCKDHRNGGVLKHVNVAYNPIQLNKPCSTADRLGGLVLSPQIIKPLVKKFNVNTYEVLRVTGSYNGMSSSMLHTKRRWDITSDRLADAERLQVVCRRDVRHRLKQLLSSGEISREIYSSFMENDPSSVVEKNRLDFCQKSATLFDIENLLECRKALYEGRCRGRDMVQRVVEDAQGVRRISYNFPWPSRLLNSSLTGCARPLSIVKKNTQNTIDLRYTWLLSTLTSNIPYIWSLISDAVMAFETETWQGHLLRFVSNKALRLNVTTMGKENPYSKIMMPHQLESIIKSNLPENLSIEENVAMYLSSMHTVLRYVISSTQLRDIENLIAPDGSCKIILVLRSDKNRRNRNRIAMKLFLGDHLYKLRYAGFTRSVILSDNTMSYHAECCIIPLQCSPEFLHYSSATAYPTTVYTVPSEIVEHWSFLCYEVSHQQDFLQYRVQYMQSIDSSAMFFCSEHRSPLARDVPRTTFTCSICREQYRKKSFVRCLSNPCSVCLCKEHYTSFLSPAVSLPDIISRNVPVIDHSARVTSNICSDILSISQSSGHSVSNSSLSSSSSSGFSSLSSSSSSSSLLSDGSYESASDLSSPSGTYSSESSTFRSEFFFEEDLEDSNCLPCVENTDSSCILPQIVDNQAESLSIPRHVIFNVDSQLLKRNSTRISGTLAQRRFLQSFVSNDPGQCLPLINFEGDVFPSIFYFQTEDGLYSGSIPQFLYNGERENRYFGFAGVDAMLRSRVKDGASLTGTDPRYIAHAFDAIVNLELRVSDTRLVQSRGYEQLLGYYTHRPAESRMSFDSVDSRRRICELASFTKSSPEYFYTHTVSMRHHPGVSPIFIQAEKLGFIDNDTDLSRVRDTSIAVQLIRSAERAVRYIWDYILRSDEEPLGRVQSIWYRSEWQSDADHAGNLPHTHGLIKLEEGSQSVTECLERIICSTSRLFNNKDHLMQIGLIESEADYSELRDRASRVQQHICQAANYRCHRIDEKSGTTKCRTPHYPPTEEYSFRDYTPDHSETALDLLLRMGLAHKDDEGNVIWNDKLIGGKFFYPAEPNEHFVPTSNNLWALHRSQCNLLYCDQYRRSRYIAKYIAASEAKATVFLKPTAMSQESVNDHNLASQSFHLEVGPREGSKYNKPIREDANAKKIGRITPFTEIVYHILQLKTLSTNLEFIRLPSIPFENRVGVYLGDRVGRQSGCSPTDLSHGNQPECVRLRSDKSLPLWRQHTASQLILYRDRIISLVSHDRYTIFSLRPPELLIFSSAEDYFQWFSRSPIKCAKKHFTLAETDELLSLMITEKLSESYFIDLLEHAVFVRKKCVAKCIQFLSYICDVDGIFSDRGMIAEQLLQSIFSPLAHAIEDSRIQSDPCFLTRFTIDSPVPIIVNSNISPTNQCKFVIHLALSFGNFETELDLFKGPNILHVFNRAGILHWQPGTALDYNQILSVLRRYVLTELLYYPSGGTHTFDSYLVGAHSSLCNALLDDTEATDLPGVLLTNISQKTTADAQKFIDDKKESTIQACLAEIRLSNPTYSEFHAATRLEPLNWNPTVDSHGFLNQDSVIEQNAALNFLLEYVNSYSSCTAGFSRFPVITGSPGVGKTFLLTQLILYCVAKGLSVLTTSLTAESALRFGGLHLHGLLPIPVSSSNAPIDVDRMVEKCLLSLGRYPTKVAFLKHIDVLCIEELGLISAELISVIDRTLRVIRQSTLPCGGILLLSTMDPLQLPPIQGRPILVSPLFISMFRIIKLKAYIRSANDNDLQRINEIGRLPRLVDQPWLIDEYCSIIRSRCNFQRDFRDVPHHILRVVGKRVAEQEAVVERENSVLQNLSPQDIFISNSIDTESTSDGLHWNSASRGTIFNLNRKCLAPDRLVIYVNCIMRITENDTVSGRYCQGQLCVIQSLPSENQAKLKVRLSPAGNRLIPEDGNYEAAGWQLLSFAFPKSSRDVYIRKGLLGRRLQFPLKPYIAYTVHRALGTTLPAVCAKLSMVDDKYHLWMRAQIYTLFSRVENLNSVSHR